MTGWGGRIRHVAALDGLRGVAVAGVLLFHGGHLTGGYLGVDLFFVLSGFLITSLLLAEGGETGGIRLGGFWARRARRLLPALFGMLLGVGLYCLFIARPEELAQIRGDAIATVAYVANWRGVFASQDYFALLRSPSPLEHTWSLAIEEQFYLIWPLVFAGLLAWKRTAIARSVLVTALVGAVGSVVLMQLLYSTTNPSRDYFGTDTRASGILIGASLAAALAIWGPVKSSRARWTLEAVGLAGVGVLAVTWTQLGGNSSRLYHGGFLVSQLAAVAVIAAAVHTRPGVLSRALSWKPLCGLGLISYGVYLWHWPVDIVVNPARAGITGWPLFFVQCAVTLAIALVSYHFLEMPIRRGAGSRREWAIAVPAVLVTLVAVFAVLQPRIDNASAIAAAGEPPPISRAALEQTRAELAITHGPNVPRVLLVGDSTAYHLGASEPSTPDAPIAVTNVPIFGCGLIGGIPQDTPRFEPPSQCAIWPSTWRIAASVFQPRLIVLLPGPWDLMDRTVGNQSLRIPSAGFRSTLEARLEQGTAIRDSGRRSSRAPLAAVPRRVPHRLEPARRRPGPREVGE